MSYLEKIQIARENADGSINPVVFDLCVEAEDMKAEAKYAEIKCLLNETADKKKGSTEVSGSLTMNFTKQSAQLINLLFFGESDTEGDYTTDAWAADTVYAVGDVVNHSNGKTSLTVKSLKGDGKSGGAEPSVTVGNATEIIVDNNVVWEATPKLVKASGVMKKTAPKFVIEYTIDDNGEKLYIRYTGCELNNLPLKLEIDDNVPKVQCNVVAGGKIDSLDANWAGNLESLAGVKLVSLGKDYYNADDEAREATLDGVAECIDSIELEINKGVTVKKGLNKCSKTSRDLKADSGKLSLDFTITQYERFKSEAEFELMLKLVGNGVYTKYTFPTVKAEDTDPTFQSKTEVLLDTKIWAVDNPTLVNWECVYPQFLDASGNVVAF
jgi:hypothetical protein